MYTVVLTNVQHCSSCIRKRRWSAVWDTQQMPLTVAAWERNHTTAFRHSVGLFISVQSTRQGWPIFVPQAWAFQDMAGTYSAMNSPIRPKIIAVSPVPQKIVRFNA